MAVVLSRLDPPALCGALADRGQGGWFADAGGGWTMVAAVPGLGESSDAAAYALAAAVRDLDRHQPVLLLWQAEPDSGYLLQRGRDADSHVWGVADEAAARGNAREAARLLGDPELEVAWRATLRGTGTGAAAPFAGLAELIGATPDAVAAAAGGTPPAGAERVVGPPPCQAVPASPAGTGAVTAAAGRSRHGLLVLAAVFAVAVAADAVRLGTGSGADFGGVLALVLFSVLAVVCLAVSVGLRRSLR